MAAMNPDVMKRYMKAVHTTMASSHEHFALTGLYAEIGEIFSEDKRELFHGQRHDSSRWAHEVGDVIYYLTAGVIAWKIEIADDLWSKLPTEAPEAALMSFHGFAMGLGVMMNKIVLEGPSAAEIRKSFFMLNAFCLKLGTTFEEVIEQSRGRLREKFMKHNLRGALPYGATLEDFGRVEAARVFFEGGPPPEGDSLHWYEMAMEAFS